MEVLNLVMLPVGEAQLQGEALHGSREILQAPVHPVACPVASEGDTLELLLVFVFVVMVFLVLVLALFVVVIVVVIVLVLVTVSVELVGKGNSEFALVDSRFCGQEHRIPVPAQPPASVHHLRTRIEDLAFLRSHVVCRANASAVAPQHHSSDPNLEARVSSR